MTETSECSVKSFICKIWTWILANSVDPDQTPQNAASDQGLHCLLKLQIVKDEIKKKKLKSPFRSIFPSLHSETIRDD